MTSGSKMKKKKTIDAEDNQPVPRQYSVVGLDNGDERKAEGGIARLLLFFFYPLTYGIVVFVFCLVMGNGEMRMMKKDLPMVLAMFPMGLTFLVGPGMRNSSDVALPVIAYTLYVIVPAIGIYTKSIRVYIVFLIMMILNFAGCCVGFHSAGH